MGPGLSSAEANLALRALIARYDLHAEHASVPVPMRQVARNEGWVVRYVEGLWPLYGAAVTLGTAAVMLVNADVELAFQRYCIAHEMTHKLAGHMGRIKACAGVPFSFGEWVNDAQEREADLLAARLLIPPHVVYSGADAQEVAAYCDVPLKLVEVFMAHRFK